MVEVMLKEYNEYIKTTFDNLITLNQLMRKQNSRMGGINSVELNLPRRTGKTTTIAEIAVNHNKVIVVTNKRECCANLKRVILNTKVTVSNPSKLINKICRFEQEPKRAFNLNHVFHVSRLKDIGIIFRGLELDGYVILLDELTVKRFMDIISDCPSNNSLTYAILLGKVPILSVESDS